MIVPNLLYIRSVNRNLWKNKSLIVALSVYPPRYREEPSIGTCEESRVLRKLTELNVNKYASTITSFHVILSLRTWHGIMISILQHSRNIAVLDVDGFLTCISSAASALENIELGYIPCALIKENFSITLKGFTCVSLICRGLLVHSVATKHKVVRLGNW